MSRMGQFVHERYGEEELAELKVVADARRAGRPATEQDKHRAAIRERIEQRVAAWRARNQGSALTR